MFDNLTCIPLRLVDPFPIKNVLSEIIKKDFFQPASKFSADLDRVQSVHDYISNAASKKDADLDNLESALYEYYFLVAAIAGKFPDNVVSMTWYGTLGYKPQRSECSTWKQLQGQIVHQLGSVHCHKAFQASQYSDEGMKVACAAFKKAAGCYEYLRTLDLPMGDFDDATLMALRSLMLAQAQEVTWNKAISGANTKNTLIARLAIRVSDMYETTLEYAEKSDKIILDWINQFKVKKNHFLAAAHYRMSIVNQDSFEYGKLVAHLKCASQFCAEAAKYKRYVSAAVVEDFLRLATVVNDTLRTAERDNDLVYLKPVPSARDLPAIEGVTMVDVEVPAPLTEQSDSGKAFASLLPFSIIQVAQAFKERQEQFVANSLIEPVQALTRMLGRFLTERDLPASIDTLQKPESLPDSIIQHSQEIISIGGTEIIEASMTEISKLAEQARDMVHACEERLHMDKYEDDLMREREGAERWTRPSSEVAGASLSARLDKMKSYLEQGHQSDQVIGDNYRSIQPMLGTYCGGHAALKRSIPLSSHSNIGPGLATLVVQLRDLLAEVDKLEKSRQRFMSSMEVKSRDHGILSTVISEYKKDPKSFQTDGVVDPMKFEAVYERHIREFGPDLKYVEQLKEQQASLEKRIHAANSEFALARMNNYDQSQSKRLETLQRFEETYLQYLELVSNLNQASKFYSDFLAKGNVVLRELDGFLYSRREEARELVIALHNQDNFHKIENSMAHNDSPLPAPRGQKANTWDPSKGIHFS